MLLGESFSIYYIAKNYLTGLTSVSLLVTKPDQTMQGLFVMNEFDPVNRKGHYVYDYTPTMEGNYLFTVFQNGAWKYSKAEYCEVRPEQMPVIKFQ